MRTKIGQQNLHPEGYRYFSPYPFPVRGMFEFDSNISVKASEATRLVGKLDGITLNLPDVDFFLKMFVKKDATASSQIEGTQATVIDALEKEIGVEENVSDAQDILFYIKALNHGIERMNELPISSRLLKEMHEHLMDGARSSHFSTPGEFRKTQNWIGGSSPSNATFVPPVVEEMLDAMHDLENFIHHEKNILPLVHIGITHAQFETLHPFLDGNGRTGRLLITILLCHLGLLEKPVLFLSSFFKQHQMEYYRRLNGYHEGYIEEWVEFFLDGVIHTAQESIAISKGIVEIRDRDMQKIQVLAKRESESRMEVLQNLYSQPIVNSKKIMEWTGFSRTGAINLLEHMVKIEILTHQDKYDRYDRLYVYKDYLKLFAE